ncbi:hypothetical protein SSX86_016150 [Deinandra increscens subsp. villosa]|uniref:Uncharacterized protein n=1 Tax=Deinandra increscens subsp. villosa TaxID=3103831 RepID=A0AAP0GVD9_9ASTR
MKWHYSCGSSPFPISVSDSGTASIEASLRKLYEQVSALKRIDSEKVHLWDYFNDQKQTVLACSDQTLEESDLQMDQSILFDVQADGFIPFGSGMDSTGNQLASLILFGSALEAAGSGPGDIASAWSALEAAGSGPGDITSAWSALEAAGSGPGDITSAWSAIKAAKSGV